MHIELRELPLALELVLFVLLLLELLKLAALPSVGMFPPMLRRLSFELLPLLRDRFTKFALPKNATLLGFFTQLAMPAQLLLGLSIDYRYLLGSAIIIRVPIIIRPSPFAGYESLLHALLPSPIPRPLRVVGHLSKLTLSILPVQPPLIIISFRLHCPTRVLSALSYAMTLEIAAWRQLPDTT